MQFAVTTYLIPCFLASNGVKNMTCNVGKCGFYDTRYTRESHFWWMVEMDARTLDRTLYTISATVGWLLQGSYRRDVYLVEWKL